MSKETGAVARERAERFLREGGNYTDPYEREKLVRDWMQKADVAEHVVEDMRQRAGEVRGKKTLDIGFGSGLYSVEFARVGAVIFGLEVNDVLLQIARENARDAHVHADLRVYDGNTFPFADNFFDYIFSVSVIEHVTDARMLIKEACRVLKPGGKFYLAFPNRWRPREAHTGIFFLSYIPRLFAQFLLRKLWKRNTVEELNLHFLSYWTMKRLLRGTPFRITFEYGGKTWPRRAMKRVLGFFGVHHSAILGTVMVVLEKKLTSSQF
ncbi:MAG: class I SAM-dependent methyltransferase [bacterium]|nr:class I SAM-dependent methyltransferase [bacterium]